MLDILLSAPALLVCAKSAPGSRRAVSGESKLSPLVLLQFAALLLDKIFGGLVPLRFFSFALVGGFGVLVHLAVLFTTGALGAGFVTAQTLATLAAMVANFQLNNVITYRDQRLRGGRLWRGLLLLHAGLRRRRVGQYRHRKRAICERPMPAAHRRARSALLLA